MKEITRVSIGYSLIEKSMRCLFHKNHRENSTVSKQSKNSGVDNSMHTKKTFRANYSSNPSSIFFRFFLSCDIHAHALCASNKSRVKGQPLALFGAISMFLHFYLFKTSASCSLSKFGAELSIRIFSTRIYGQKSSITICFLRKEDQKI